MTLPNETGGRGDWILAATEKFRFVVGQSGIDTEAGRDQLAADLVERVLSSDVEIVAIGRESEHPGQTMAAGPIVTIEMAARAGRLLLDALRSWLASRRTEIEVQTPDGRKIKISASRAGLRPSNA